MDRVNWLLVCSIFLAAAAFCQENQVQPVDLSRAQNLDDISVKDIRSALMPQEIISAEYIWQPRNDIENVEDLSFDLQVFRIRAEPYFELTPDLYLGLGVRYSVYQFLFEFDNDAFDRRHLHSLSFPVSLTLTADRWLFSGEVTTSMNTDFRGFNRHDMQVNGGAVVGYWIHPNLVLQFGLFATNDFGDITVVPAGGLVWKPDPMFDVSMLIPFFADINLNLSETVTIFAHYELDGNQFRFRYREFGEVFEEDGQFTFYRFGLGVKCFLTEGVSAKLILGGTSEGRYEFRGISAEKDDGRIESAFFLLVGISIDENFFD